MAIAADVAKKTVFDRAEAREQDLGTLIRERPAVAAFRQQLDAFLDRPADGEAGCRRRSIVRLVRASPTLWRRGLEVRERQAAVLAADAGRPEWDPVAQTVARSMLAAHFAVFFEVHRNLDAGASPREAVEAARQYVPQVFGLLSNGLADYPQH